jgi:hypothetical protein
VDYKLKDMVVSHFLSRLLKPRFLMLNYIIMDM